MEKARIAILLICCGRLHLRDKLFNLLNNQITENLFDYQLFYLDCTNKKTSPAKNIAHARNLLLENGKNFDFLAILDDDEIPQENWLLNLYLIQKQCSADVINGAVLTAEDSSLKLWQKHLLKTVFFTRLNYLEGSKNYNVKSTNNCLIKTEFIRKNNLKFDDVNFPWGGEDTDFFHRAKRLGASFCWTRKATVYECIDKDKINLKWMFLRAFRCGGTSAKLFCVDKSRLAKTFFLIFGLLKLSFSLAILPLSIFLLVFNLRWFSFVPFKIIYYFGETMFFAGKERSEFCI